MVDGTAQEKPKGSLHRVQVSRRKPGFSTLLTGRWHSFYSQSTYCAPSTGHFTSFSLNSNPLNRNHVISILQIRKQTL